MYGIWLFGGEFLQNTKRTNFGIPNKINAVWFPCRQRSLDHWRERVSKPIDAPYLPRSRGREGGGRCLLDRPVKPGDDSGVESYATEGHDGSAYRASPANPADEH